MSFIYTPHPFYRMNNVIHLGAHAEFTIVTLVSQVLNNQEYRVLYHNEYIAGILHTFQERELVYLDENMAEMLFHDAATDLPELINYMTVDNNNIPYEGIDEARLLCEETLYELQLEFDPVIELYEQIEIVPT
jgi:hypothetical protein